MFENVSFATNICFKSYVYRIQSHIHITLPLLKYLFKFVLFPIKVLLLTTHIAMILLDCGLQLSRLVNLQ